MTEPVPFSLQRAEDYGPVEVISHWHPNLTINMVDDHTPWVKGSVPPPLDQCKGRDVPGLPCSQGGFPRLVLLSPLLGGRVFRLLWGTGVCFSGGGVTPPHLSGELVTGLSRDSGGLSLSLRRLPKGDDGDDGSRGSLSPAQPSFCPFPRLQM